ncbi:MAG: hypothetical protein PHT33_09305 [bacterium]|nr:hypothetical protein [bacterium]
MRERYVGNTGLALVEVLVAMVVLLIGILAIIKVFPVGLTNIEKTRYDEIAKRFVDGHIDELSAWNFDDLPVSIPETDQLPDGARTEFSIRGVDISFNEPGIMEKKAVAGSSFEAVQCSSVYDVTEQELRFIADTPPAAGDIIRISLRNKSWFDQIRNDPAKSYLDGLPDGVENIYIYYANGDFGSERPVYDAPNPETGANIYGKKIIEIKLTWSEGGNTRKLTRQAVVRR